MKIRGMEIDLCPECELKIKLAERIHAAQPRARALRTWRTLLTRCGNRDGNNPSYEYTEVRMTQAEFLAWAIPAYQEYLEQHPESFLPEETKDTASLDRIDPKGHYEIGNLQVISMGENARLSNQHRNVHAPEGMAWCSICQQYLPVDQFAKSTRRFNGLQKRCRQCEHIKRGRGDPRYAARGIDNHNATITKEQGQAIRDRYLAGGVLMRELAAENEVSKACVQEIVARKKRWVDLV